MALTVWLLLSVIQIGRIISESYNCTTGRKQDYTPFFIQSVHNGKYLDVAYRDSSLGTIAVTFRKRSFEFRNQSLIVDMCSDCAFRLMITKKGKGPRCLSSNSIAVPLVGQSLDVTGCLDQGLDPVYGVRLLGINRAGLIFLYNDNFVLTTDTNIDPKVTSPVWVQQPTLNNAGQIWKIVGGPQPFPFTKTNYAACLQNLTKILP